MPETLKTPLSDAFAGVQFIGLADAVKLMRGKVRGQPPHIQTVRRWANPRKGYRAVPWGDVAILQTVRLGGDICTTVEWVAAFEERRLRLGCLAVGQERPPTERQAAAAHKRAERSLDRRGCK